MQSQLDQQFSINVSAPRMVSTVTVETQTAERQANESQPVLLDTENTHMSELGLGRGVDGTSPTAWLNRTAFQVRRISHSNVVGTDEGGSLQKYVKEVTSVRSQQSTLKASIDVPKSPVTIGMDAEYSRAVSQNQKSVGVKIHNRTVSFASDFDEASDWMFRDPHNPPPTTHNWNSGSPTTITVLKPAETGNELKIVPRFGRIPQTMGAAEDKGKKAHKLEVKLTFEERMCQWILDHQPNYTNKVPTTPDEVAGGEAEEGSSGAGESSEKGQPPSPSSIVEKFTEFFKKYTEEDFRQEVDPHCEKFVNYFRITHYVSAIQLGAVEYAVMEEGEYTRRFGGGAHAGVERIANFGSSTHFDWKKQRKHLALSKIGVMREDPNMGTVVHRAEEAVIGVEIKPLGRLIRHPLLGKSLQRALQLYMDSAQHHREGPFHITCGNDRIFLKVTDPGPLERGVKKNEVIGVTEPVEASRFFIVPTCDSKHPHEFTIAYHSKKEYRDVNPIPRYLNVSTNVFGNNDGPLKVKFNIKERNCRLTLQNRLSSYDPGDIRPWLAGQEAFYLRCARRHIRRNGYVCVKWQEAEERFVTACVWSVKKHDEDSDSYTVFRLVRPEHIEAGKLYHEDSGTDKDRDNTEDGPNLASRPKPATTTVVADVHNEPNSNR